MVKVDLICGMLGSGKTTLIKRMLDTVYAGKRIIVIENEYGQVNLDAIELRKKQVEVKELTQGCVCCTMKLSFLEVFEQLGQREDIDYVVIEPSGMADIAEFVSFCRSIKNIQMNRMIMVVNAKKITKFLDIAGSLFINQIKSVNMICLNFAEELPEEQITLAKERLLGINPGAQICEKPIRTMTSRDFADRVESVRTSVRELGDKRMYIMMKSRGIKEDSVYQQLVSWSEAVSQRQLTEFCGFLDDVLCEDIYRIKGYLEMADGSFRKLDYVTGDLFIEATNVVEGSARNKLVVIGRKHNVMWLERKLMNLFK